VTGRFADDHVGGTMRSGCVRRHRGGEAGRQKQ
jgi:hypothetical protein